ncbi:hypothetical protein PHYBLDRAFT_68131 [Phycomyces blakesleeanus NRRL 1555(-)]|uniref:Uncharacterized protein n=1 Tax=Phycomyces blakesleeanus (strain ATCC 8743b / DSM 1359 / FGSC 10004 / NBRC 33097 / NRRL 1555) TaxID=763407 RepID=A0A163E6Z5_PHYB8|nr:hypothetical protein PHYBLDRAFT_68131 [Phycomyces blakesleeanus NRRL 1555(-)]OAD77060.1 hypothetical protein PHYBLDRAFT_68131 [Phycomyces blakesleeanus NRRL 1555(-)]|eukprot:XP_018295100.1 hypothetical protein PHYBLDRAFT_68131 [Phycomyces blakesleeanus NRRL 1555(-)]
MNTVGFTSHHTCYKLRAIKNELPVSTPYGLSRYADYQSAIVVGIKRRKKKTLSVQMNDAIDIPVGKMGGKDQVSNSFLLVTFKKEMQLVHTKSRTQATERRNQQVWKDMDASPKSFPPDCRAMMRYIKPPKKAPGRCWGRTTGKYEFGHKKGYPRNISVNVQSHPAQKCWIQRYV